MAIKKEEDTTGFETPQTVRVKKKDLSKILNCSICNNFFKDPVNITECLHIFCKECINKKITEDNLKNCPVCDVYLGCMPLEKIRPDKTWSSIRAALAPLPGQATSKDEPESKPIKLLKEVVKEETEQSTKKERSLTSLVNEVKLERSEASNVPINSNHSNQYNGQQQILPKDRRRSQKIQKRVELAKFFLKRLDDHEEEAENMPRKTDAPNQGVSSICPQSAADNASNQHATRVVPVWLSLVPAVNQEGVEVLPQIPCSYLMIKDGTLPVLFIKKYLAQKLQLHSEDEVEISLWNMQLPPDLEIQHLIQMWSRTTSEKMPAVVGDSAEDFVMVLYYGRK